MSEPLWTPPADAWESTRLGRFANRHRPEAVGDYPALLAWSTSEPTSFWSAVWDELAIEASTEPDGVLAGTAMPAVQWFPGATLNYAKHVLRGNGLADDDIVCVSVSQSRATRELSMVQLRDQVRRAAAGLRRCGVGRGDRVAAFLPNIDQALVAFLATASIGAIWSSCAPEFGVRAVLDRWSQIEPTVLLTVDGYRYGDRDVPLGEVVAGIRGGLPSLRSTVVLPYLGDGSAVPDALAWDDLVAPTDDQLTVEPVPFDHPLYVLYSSGTTGLPKAIVHGHGGILLEHGKQLALQMDLGPGDRFFWFSTTGWMMWNYLVSGPLVGASVVLFDGNPGHPDLDTLWALMGSTGTTMAGLSAPFLMACRKAGLRPGADHDLSSLRAVGSTGAPLPASGFEWIAAEVGPVHIANISGGTDVCSAFLGSAPVLPVVAGTIPCRQLGWSVEAFDPDGNPVLGREGELVITEPAPSMPLGLWGDDDGTRYRETYFSTYPGVWCHGDWLTIAEDGTAVISGRSDATLNRGGVRLGTADYDAVVDAHPAVADSLIVHLENGVEIEDGDEDGGLGTLILFVVPAPGTTIDDQVKSDLRRAIRQELSPRH
ncbi:MAG: acetoacetate--CoA ligase, partial [Actinomycetota bacterium]